jgi:hypothetical protein
VGEKTATIAFNQEFDMMNPLFAQALSSLIVYEIWNCRAWNFDVEENAIPVLVKEIPSASNGGISADGKLHYLRRHPLVGWAAIPARTSSPTR